MYLKYIAVEQTPSKKAKFLQITNNLKMVAPKKEQLIKKGVRTSLQGISNKIFGKNDIKSIKAPCERY